jgi:hypothetical protein
MAAGGGVMAISAGPTLLAVPLTEQVHGSGWVAGAAIAACLGTLLSSSAIAVIGRLRVPVLLRWPMWGLGMLAGWTVAPLFAPLVLLAQFCAGTAQAAFDGDMDAQVVGTARPESVTRDLAYAASVRALGGAISVRVLPALVTAPVVGVFAGAAVVVLVSIATVTWLAASSYHISGAVCVIRLGVPAADFGSSGGYFCPH